MLLLFRASTSATIHGLVAFNNRNTDNRGDSEQQWTFGLTQNVPLYLKKNLYIDVKTCLWLFKKQNVQFGFNHDSNLRQKN